MVQMIAAEARDIQIGPAVVVVISDSSAHSVTFSLQAGPLRDVNERAMSGVAIEAIPIAWVCFIRRFTPRHRIDQTRTVDEEQVEFSVTIVVQPCHSGAHCFNQIFLGSVRGLMPESNAGLADNVFEE